VVFWEICEEVQRSRVPIEFMSRNIECEFRSISISNERKSVSQKLFLCGAYNFGAEEGAGVRALRTFQEDYFRLMELKSFARPAAMILSIQSRGAGWMGIPTTLFHSALRRRAVRKGRRTRI
jgi:hypothetical protein